MWKWVDMADHPTNLWWQPGVNLPSVMLWLHDRARRHSDWLDDNSKYIDIRFDSRTGSFLVRHGSDDKILVWFEEE
jgi:hypothetical protein